MRTKAWLALVAITLAVVAGASYTVWRQGSSTAEQAGGGKLFPDLMGRINQVATLSLQQGAQRWTMVRGADGWTMAEKYGYPVAPDKVKKAVVALADMRIVEPKTARPELYGKIGVADVAKPDSEAILMELADSGGARLAALLVGKTRTYEVGSEPAQVYVRKPDDQRAYLVEARLDVKADPMTWLVKETVKLDKSRIDKVVTTHPDGELVVIERGDDKVDYFKLRDMPAGHKLRSTQRIGAIAAALEFVGHLDVAPESSKDFAGKAVVTELETGDGMRVTVEVLPEPDADDNYWARFRAEFDPALVRAGKDDTPEPDAVKREVAEINGRVAGWAYLMPDYRAENLLRRMSDLTQPAPPPDDAAGKDHS